MPRLFIINTTCNRGSTGHIAEAIGTLAQSQGWEVKLAHGGRYIQPSKLTTIQIQKKWMAYLDFMFSYLTGHHGLWSRMSTRRLVRQIQSFDPDIIHLHNIHGYFINYPILFTYLQHAGKQVIWTLHDCWTTTGRCACYNKITTYCTQWKTGCQKCPVLTDYPAALIDRAKQDYLRKKTLFTSIKHVTLVSVSHWLAENIQQSFLKDYPIRTIYNGVNTQVFKPATHIDELRKKWNIPVHAFVVIGVASVWEVRKGLADLLFIAKNVSCEVVIVGVTPEQKKQIGHQVHAITRTENTTDLAELYALADVFVNPTYSDTFPTTNLEALASGTPVITYQTDGSPEAIDATTGIVVKQGDVAGLCQAVETLMQKPLDRRNCRNRATKLFNQVERYQEYIRLYTDIIK